MKILYISIILFLSSCQENDSDKAVSVESPNPIKNGIVYRDSQGNFLSDSQRDSLIQVLDNVQALRRFDNENNNTEYIIFQNYEDLRGFVPDDAIDNLIEENKLRRAGGPGAVMSKRINDQWKNKPLPAGDLKMIDGSTKSFSDFKGSILVINFWYINCGPCIVEMPYLNKLVDKYSDDDIQFLALSFDSIPDIKNFLNKTDFKYDQGSISRSFMYDFTPVSPGHFIVDKNGIIRDIIIGAPRDTKLIFDKLINLIEKNKK